MTPSRLKFTIKMLNALIIFKNNFFLTFRHSECLGLNWNFTFSVAVKIVMVYFSLYVTTLQDFCVVVLCGGAYNAKYGTFQLINIVIGGVK